jgi:hypothetical protein
MSYVVILMSFQTIYSINYNYENTYASEFQPWLRKQTVHCARGRSIACVYTSESER